MRWTLLRRLGALGGVIAMLTLAAPPAYADGGALVDSPTLSLADLGQSDTLSFFGGSGSTRLSVPAMAGLVPVALNTTLHLPFNIRYGTLTVTQDDRIISKIGLPLADLAPVVVPLDGVEVVDDSVDVDLTMTVLPEEGFCLDTNSPVELINNSVSYAGIEIAPTTVADFLPPILRQLTIAVPSPPSRAESDTAVQLAAAVLSRYRGQAPKVVVYPLAEGATSLGGPSLPFERQIVIKEGPDEGLSLVGTVGVPELLISGPADQLRVQSSLLTDPALGAALSAKVVARNLHSSAPLLPGDSTTLAELGQRFLTEVGLSPRVTVGLDQTRYGRPTQGFRVRLMGSYTPIPNALGAHLTASVGGEVLDSWPAEADGLIDRWVDVPDRLVQRYTSLAVAVDVSGDTGACDDFRLITLTINGSSVVESTRAQPPIPPGFGSLPQALMPQMQVGIGGDSFADTVRATQIVVGLQRQSLLPLSTTVTSLEEAIDSNDPAILVSADGWADTSIELPVSTVDQNLTLAGLGPDNQQTTLTLDPGIKFGSLQTVFDGQRSILVATSNGAPDQLDELLRWLDENARRWSQLSGNAIVAVAGREPAAVLGRTPLSVYGPPGSPAPQEAADQGDLGIKTWWIAAGVVAGAGVGALAMWLRGRRSRPGSVNSGQTGEGQP